MDGFHKGAQKLSLVSSEDRAWVLSKLETEDRVRLMAALQDMHTPREKSEDSDAMHPPALVSSGQFVKSPVENETDRLSTADADTMRILLSNQPDWVCAILVANARWPWVGNYLASLEADKLMRLETLVRRLDTTIRPRVRAAVAEIVNTWLSTNNHFPLQESAFDMLLSRLRRKEPTAPINGSST